MKRVKDEGFDPAFFRFLVLDFSIKNEYYFYKMLHLPMEVEGTRKPLIRAVSVFYSLFL
jgi:hypothetical protein